MRLPLATGFDSRRISWAAAVIAPLVCVQAVRMLGAGLATAPAAVVPVPAAESGLPPAAPPRVLSVEQRKALQYLQSDALRGVLSSPMQAAPATIKDTPPPPAHAQATQPAPIDPVTQLSVTSIMGSEQQAVAGINHALRRVGDEVAPGWKIIQINARERSVLLRNTDGRELVIHTAR